ncbi:MAG: undecaprenyldiphospho-muramoylpentapeptide beta-N-acetylglucosaminyltransferase [Desulfobacteraceae bacterium]|nr:undecaprenyldiphospho-muramoylpentapeptide beta-N-acetylglucosaminyltransferase [Desulfobacteraceae bacterium]
MVEYRTIQKSGRGLHLVIAGGGTGGHLFPAIAVAQAFLNKDQRNRVLFINSGRPLDRNVLSEQGWPMKTIAIEGIKGRELFRQALAGFKLPAALWRSASLLRGFQADMVLGVGGYSSGPVVLSAWIKGIAFAVHEQNQIPGVTNRWLGNLSRRVYLSFEQSRAYFSPNKTIVTGNPVRNEILSLAGKTRKDKTGSEFTVLIVGGSQGARAINQAVMESLKLFKNKNVYHFIHQTGEQDQELVRQAYCNAGIKNQVKAFFNDMAACYQQADLIICRSGATTVAEITTIGKAAVFIPYPFAADDHQTGNAQSLVNAGAARIIPQDKLTPETLTETIETLKHNRQLRKQMEQKALDLGRPDAAEMIVKDLYNIFNGAE